VLRAAARIPYGQTESYGEIARRLRRPQAARAVGQALGANPLPLVIPCHRVLGARGALGGYSAARGVAVKRWLLRLEGA
jgi:methylated-DNA-[protein]-cysteine S-methyltransferase